MTNQTVILHCYSCGKEIKAEHLVKTEQCSLTCTGCGKVFTMPTPDYVLLVSSYSGVDGNPLHITLLEPPDTTWTLPYKGLLIHRSKGDKFYVKYEGANGKFKTYSSKYLHAVKTFIDRRL
jgi:hypothetical protein